MIENNVPCERSRIWCVPAIFLATLALSITGVFFWLGGQVNLTAHTKLFVMSFFLCLAGLVVFTSSANPMAFLERRIRNMAAGHDDRR